MPLATDTTTRRRLFFTVVSLIGVVIVWYFGFGDHTPSRQDAERFLDWGLDNGREIVGFRDSGEAEKLTTGVVGKIDEVECHPTRQTGSGASVSDHPGVTTASTGLLVPTTRNT